MFSGEGRTIRHSTYPSKTIYLNYPPGEGRAVRHLLQVPRPLETRARVDGEAARDDRPAPGLRGRGQRVHALAQDCQGPDVAMC